MLKTYQASCHCGGVRFEAEIDLTAPTYRCNCSICSRTRFWPAIATPDRVRLIAGEDLLTKYLFHSMKNEHFFCSRCGVRPFGIGTTPDGQRIYGINIGCLEDVTPEDLAAAPIVYIDGLHDHHAAPEVTSYL